ncbi:hypothetical protein ABBQ32_006872 [Trebouxia sp. C0010 RCD-2024]
MFCTSGSRLEQLVQVAWMAVFASDEAGAAGPASTLQKPPWPQAALSHFGMLRKRAAAELEGNGKLLCNLCTRSELLDSTLPAPLMSTSPSGLDQAEAARSSHPESVEALDAAPILPGCLPRLSALSFLMMHTSRSQHRRLQQTKSGRLCSLAGPGERLSVRGTAQPVDWDWPPDIPDIWSRQCASVSAMLQSNVDSVIAQVNAYTAAHCIWHGMISNILWSWAFVMDGRNHMQISQLLWLSFWRGHAAESGQSWFKQTLRFETPEKLLADPAQLVGSMCASRSPFWENSGLMDMAMGLVLCWCVGGIPCQATQVFCP